MGSGLLLIILLQFLLSIHCLIIDQKYFQFKIFHSEIDANYANTSSHIPAIVYTFLLQEATPPNSAVFTIQNLKNCVWKERLYDLYLHTTWLNTETNFSSVLMMVLQARAHFIGFLQTEFRVFLDLKKPSKIIDLFQFYDPIDERLLLYFCLYFSLKDADSMQKILDFFIIENIASNFLTNSIGTDQLVRIQKMEHYLFYHIYHYEALLRTFVFFVYPFILEVLRVIPLNLSHTKTWKKMASISGNSSNMPLGSAKLKKSKFDQELDNLVMKVLINIEPAIIASLFAKIELLVITDPNNVHPLDILCK